MTTAIKHSAAVSDPSLLAAIGREMGLELCRFTNVGATCYGVRDPLRDAVLTVTGFSCDCPRFVVRGTCPHHAFLLDALGWTA